MKRFLFLTLIIVLTIGLLTSCRPPELEGAFVDFNAGRIDSALELAIKAAEKYPTNSEAWFLLGKIYAKKDSVKKMVDAFDKSLAIDNKFEAEITNLKNLTFQNTFNRGVNAFNKYIKIEDKTSEEAKKTIDAAIKNFKLAALVKDDYQTHELIARSYTFLDDIDNAGKYFKKLTEIEPDSAKGWIALGNYYFENNEPEKAIETYRQALEIEPANEVAITNMALSYDKMKDYENALKTYEQAMEVIPEEKAFPFNLGLIYYNMSADTLETKLTKEQRMEYLEDALQYFNRALELDPEMKDAYRAKSDILIELKRFEEGKEVAKIGTEKYPEDVGLWFNLFKCYSHLGNVQKANETAEKINELQGE